MERRESDFLMSTSGASHLAAWIYLQDPGVIDLSHSEGKFMLCVCVSVCVDLIICEGSKKNGWSGQLMQMKRQTATLVAQNDSSELLLCKNLFINV